MVAQLIAEPASTEELGLDPGLLTDLALKTVFFRGRMTRAELSDALKLSASVTQDLMQSLTLDGLASVLGAESGTPSNYMYTLTGKGA